MFKNDSNCVNETHVHGLCKENNCIYQIPWSCYNTLSTRTVITLIKLSIFLFSIYQTRSKTQLKVYAIHFKCVLIWFIPPPPPPPPHTHTHTPHYYRICASLKWVVIGLDNGLLSVGDLSWFTPLGKRIIEANQFSLTNLHLILSTATLPQFCPRKMG